MPATLNLPVWFEIGSLVVLMLILAVDLLLVVQAAAHPVGQGVGAVGRVLRGARAGLRRR